MLLLYIFLYLYIDKIKKTRMAKMSNMSYLEEDQIIQSMSRFVYHTY